MKETMIKSKVTYTLKHRGKFFIIEHVPARICRETGEEYFAPEIVEHIHVIINEQRKPDKMMETPVYNYK